ncbi:hypothetical protein HY449_01630 [Candidatus Pacearchaeota archaeon]|nr:hypothetical protein [Candidatus Pacearchaeota archaeon]
MAEAIIYPGISDEDLKSLEDTLKKRDVEYAISPNESSGGWHSVVSIYGEVYHNSPTLLKRLGAF